MSFSEGRDRPVGPIPESFVTGDNAALIASIAPIYLTGSVLDVTYGQGVWWKRFTPEPFAHHDLAADGVDFRALPYADRSWDAVCFDPPYIPSRASETSTRRAVDHRNAYGLNERRNRAELEALVAEGLAECGRVSRRWVLAKCCDYAENPETFRLGHVTTIAAGEAIGLRVHDLIVHAGKAGPSNHRIRTIRRARRAHSYLIVFKVPRRRVTSSKPKGGAGVETAACEPVAGQTFGLLDGEHVAVSAPVFGRYQRLLGCLLCVPGAEA